MYRTALADKSSPELLQDGVHREQNPPEFAHRRGIVGRMLLILVEPNGVGNLHRHRPDFYVDPSRCEHPETLLVKVCNAARLQWKCFDNIVAGFKNQPV